MENTEQKKQEYNEYIKQVTPTHNPLINTAKAFVVGGLVCLIGQCLINLFMSYGMDQKSAGSWNLICLIALSIILTGFNLFSKLAKFAGAGVLVPITGFANSVVSPAIEFKKEGQVFGVGCKIFTIAGPVILYGIFTSWVLGVIYYILMMLGFVK
ncbi:MAG: stage V sporulation protein AC [Lachnospiraceae bacterium]